MFFNVLLFYPLLLLSTSLKCALHPRLSHPSLFSGSPDAAFGCCILSRGKERERDDEICIRLHLIAVYLER